VKNGYPKQLFTDPPSPVDGIRVCDASYYKSSAAVTWSPSSGDPVCGPVSYNVTISPSDGVMMVRITNTFYNFTGLTPGTNYTVTVAGINMAGIGESNMIMFYIPNVNIVIPSGELH